MQNLLTVRYALMCLQALAEQDNGRGSPAEISRQRGMPLYDCVLVLNRLGAAGLVEVDAEGNYVLLRPLHALTALDVLSALSTPVQTLTRFRMLVGPHRGLATRKTLEAIVMAERANAYVSEDGNA